MNEETNFSEIAQLFLDIMRDWENKVIPVQTKNCLRTMLAKVITVNNTNRTATIRIAASPEDGSEDLQNIIITNHEIYSVGDIVVIGYTSNNLTNAFIMFKDRKGED